MSGRVSRRAKPLYDGRSVKLPNGSGEMEDCGGLAQGRNIRRLITCRAFLYEDERGPISVRLERKARGSDTGYWVAYKRQNGRLRKTYICEAWALDPYNLDEAYQRLMPTPRHQPSREEGAIDT